MRHAALQLSVAAPPIPAAAEGAPRPNPSLSSREARLLWKDFQQNMRLRGTPSATKANAEEEVWTGGWATEWRAAGRQGDWVAGRRGGKGDRMRQAADVSRGVSRASQVKEEASDVVVVRKRDERRRPPLTEAQVKKRREALPEKLLKYLRKQVRTPRLSIRFDEMMMCR